MFQSLSFLPILISKRALRDLVALWGQKSMKKRNLRIQGRMQIFEKMSQKALNRVLTLPDYSIWPELLISSGIIDLQNNRVCKQFKHWKYRISVPMLYIAFVKLIDQLITWLLYWSIKFVYKVSVVLESPRWRLRVVSPCRQRRLGDQIVHDDIHWNLVPMVHGQPNWPRQTIK